MAAPPGEPPKKYSLLLDFFMSLLSIHLYIYNNFIFSIILFYIFFEADLLGQKTLYENGTFSFLIRILPGFKSNPRFKTVWWRPCKWGGSVQRFHVAGFDIYSSFKLILLTYSFTPSYCYLLLIPTFADFL